MKIKVVDEFNHQEISILLLENTNDEMEFYKENIFVENRTYSIFLDLGSEIDVSDVHVFLGDIYLEVNFEETSNLVYLLKERIFENCYDTVSIKIEICYHDGNVRVLKTPNLYVAIKKITCQYIQNMLQDIEDNYPGIIEAFYSSAKKKVGLSEIKTRGFNDTISLLSLIYKTFKDVFPIFQQSVKKTICEEYKSMDSISGSNLDNQVINWILMHPEHIKQSKYPTPIRVNKKYYNIDRISHLQKKESKETYENQIVLGFINIIILYINEKCSQLESVIKNFEKEIPHDEIKKLQGEYDHAYNTVIFYYRQLLKDFKNYADSFEKLFEGYSFCLDCTPVMFATVPRYTFIFRQQYHYHRCFETIVLWFEKGNCNFHSIGYFLKLKRLSKIFEYYTLLKLQESILKNGFKINSEPECLIYDQDKLNDINNFYTYISKNENIKISLYYEPYIYSDEIKFGIDLYATGYNFSKIMKINTIERNDHWNPDFILKIENENDKLYFILDSKFSSYSSVCRYHIAQLANKYILGMESKNGCYSKIAGVWAIYPSERLMRLEMKNTLPIIAIEPLLSRNGSLDDLIKKFLGIFNKINLEIN